MEGKIGHQKGTLIRYNEVLKKLNIPKIYLIDYTMVMDIFVFFNLTKTKESKLGKVIPAGTRLMRKEFLRLKISKDDFRKKFGLKYKHFDAEAVFKEKKTIMRIRGDEELQYYLDKDSERVYFWFSEEKEYSWREKLFVETK